MQNLFLVQDNDFNALATELKLTPEQLVEKIENGFKNNDMELCDYEDAGVQVTEICKNWGYELPVVALKFFGRSDNMINDLFGKLYFKHVNDECPQCGHELEVEYDSGHANGKSYEWENKTCSNSNCDYGDTGEPDWDCMPGGHDYY